MIPVLSDLFVVIAALVIGVVCLHEMITAGFRVELFLLAVLSLILLAVFCGRLLLFVKALRGKTDARSLMCTFRLAGSPLGL
jgi:hypothetical protein